MMGMRGVALILIQLAVVVVITRSAVVKIPSNVQADPHILQPQKVLPSKLPLDKSARFIHGFMASIYVIVISELGDKTFFIAAILSIHHPRPVVYLGAMSALITMTVLSALLGYTTELLPRIYTFYLSGVLFIIFGVKMLYDAYKMSPDDANEEYQEVEQQIGSADVNSGSRCHVRVRALLRKVLSPIFAEAFLMTFLAEWGDRSQLTTIVLAARENVLGVITGGILGHGLCTGLAVISGRLVAQKISVKWRKLLVVVWAFNQNSDYKYYYLVRELPELHHVLLMARRKSLCNDSLLLIRVLFLIPSQVSVDCTSILVFQVVYIYSYRGVDEGWSYT
ncbi:unnamed protein product [Dibothriocephalus latus]|uniref:GDT1 family protein n=1 Tax=Dibothriocephalus latus TaxID=60516 RepID=A0A3P7QCF2_DIBLA|nr:unnamed protein product [Dibothriocephalus latus]